MSTSNIFAHVDHVDACGAPVLAAGTVVLDGICENDLPGDTLVRVYGFASGGKAEGFLTTVRLAVAERDVARGHLRRIGAHSFEVASLRPAIGPGLTGAQKRRRHLATAAS